MIRQQLTKQEVDKVVSVLHLHVDNCIRISRKAMQSRVVKSMKDEVCEINTIIDLLR